MKNLNMVWSWKAGGIREGSTTLERTIQSDKKKPAMQHSESRVFHAKGRIGVKTLRWVGTWNLKNKKKTGDLEHRG